MDDGHLWQMTDLPACTLDAQAEIRLLAVDKETLVEEAGAEQRLAAGEHERARGPVAVPLPVVRGPLEYPLAGPGWMDRPTLGGKSLAQVPGYAGKATNRGPQLAVGGDLPHADQADPGTGIQ